MTPDERRAHLRRIASSGGKARALKLSPERRREIAALGFAALARKRFGNVRKKAVRALIERGQLAPDRPGDPETLRALHRIACPEQYEPEATAQQARHEPAECHRDEHRDEPVQARHEPATDAGGCPRDELPF